MKKFIIYMLATVFGAGYFPKLPGTFTSLLTTVAAYYLLRLSLSQYLLLTFTITLLAVYVTGEANRLAREKDLNIFSLDEVPGQLLAFLPLYFYLPGSFTIRIILLACGFGFFRFFDILKPGIIRSSEALPGGVGVVLDDILSGLAAALCLQLVIIFL